jgi:general secretion pathway protein I
MRSKDVAGMTLIEVLVALLVLGVAMMAAIRATGITVDNAAALRTRVCAEWVALDQLELHRARRDWLALGKQPPQAASQGGLDFLRIEDVSDTPSPLVRRVDVHVQLAARPGRDVALAGGYLIRQDDGGQP